MNFLTTVFYAFVYLVATLCFMVLLEHGISGFIDGARRDFVSLFQGTQSPAAPAE